jgi:hypothetical protein
LLNADEFEVRLVQKEAVLDADIIALGCPQPQEAFMIDGLFGDFEALIIKLMEIVLSKLVVRFL